METEHWLRPSSQRPRRPPSPARPKGQTPSSRTRVSRATLNEVGLTYGATPSALFTARFMQGVPSDSPVLQPLFVRPHPEEMRAFSAPPSVGSRTPFGALLPFGMGGKWHSHCGTCGGPDGFAWPSSFFDSEGTGGDDWDGADRSFGKVGGTTVCVVSSEYASPQSGIRECQAHFYVNHLRPGSTVGRRRSNRFPYQWRFYLRPLQKGVCGCLWGISTPDAAKFHGVGDEHASRGSRDGRTTGIIRSPQRPQSDVPFVPALQTIPVPKTNCEDRPLRTLAFTGAGPFLDDESPSRLPFRAPPR